MLNLAALGAIALAFAPMPGLPALEGTPVAPRTQDASPAAAAEPFSILVFSRTAGFRHASIPDGVVALTEIAEEQGFSLEATEDAALFTDEYLDAFAGVVFLNTTGDVLDDEQQAAFERYIAKGRGYVGVHSASDTEYDWPWYGQLVGAYFKGHPRIQPADVVVEDADHPSTAHLPERWNRTDEWYNFHKSPRPNVRVLMHLDTSTYEGSTMPDDHPTAWCHEFGGGRAWYTGGGHTSESFADPAFRDHLLGGILWATGRAEPATPTKDERDDAVVR